ncbi:MAG: hypothetical protein KAR21_08405, partial [Spirochaetales bacterium]|nr:hypothetical protein [Spirochaetales bacterium]
MKYFTIIMLLFSLSAGLAAESPADLGNRPDDDFPLSKTIYRDGDSTPELTLLPDVPGAEVIRERFLSYKPEITIQRIYRIKLSELFSGDTADQRVSLFTEIVNIFGKPETQVGYTYHSATRDKDIVLFEESYISDKRGKQISGFSYTPNTLPGKIDYYQYIDEANFAGSVFDQKIIVEDDFLRYQSTNIKSLKFFIIPVLKKEGTRNDILFFSSGEYLYIYNCAQVLKEPAVKNLGFPIHIPSMFRKR